MKGIPAQKVPMRIPVKSLPRRQANSAKVPPEGPASIPIERRKWRHIPCVGNPSEASSEVFESRKSVETLPKFSECNLLGNFDEILQRIRSDSHLDF